MLKKNIICYCWLFLILMQHELRLGFLELLAWCQPSLVALLNWGQSRYQFNLTSTSVRKYLEVPAGDRTNRVCNITLKMSRINLLPNLFNQFLRLLIQIIYFNKFCMQLFNSNIELVTLLKTLSLSAQRPFAWKK